MFFPYLSSFFNKQKNICIVVFFGIGFFVFLSFIAYQVNIDSRHQFQKTLKGEIVFLRRGSDYVSSIYKIAASGGESLLLFKNTESGVVNASSLYPRWTADGHIQFEAMSSSDDGDITQTPWLKWEMQSDGTHPHVVDTNPQSLSSLDVRSSDLKVIKGDIYMSEKGVNFKIYNFVGFFPDINWGASEVSWSPDKQYVVFQACPWFRSCGIYVADKSGKHVVRIAEGTDPDWRY